MHAVSGGIGEKSGKSLVFFLIKEFQKRWGKPPSQNMVTGKENGHQKLVTGKKNGHQKLVTGKKNGFHLLVTVKHFIFSAWAAGTLLDGQDDSQGLLFCCSAVCTVSSGQIANTVQLVYSALLYMVEK